MTALAYDQVVGLPLSTQVAAMRDTFGLPTNTSPTILDGAALRSHYAIIGEEFAELTEAIFGTHAGNAMKRAVAQALTHLTADHDYVKTVDALGDIAITVHGMAAEMGASLDDVTTEQMRANFSKVDDFGRPVFNAAGKFIKDGTNYVAPDLPSVLGIPADFGKTPALRAPQSETLERDGL